jgi:LAS superfamily LD-carboxypeptidase LdcB
MNIEVLLGKTTDHLVPLEGTKFLLNKQMIKDFLRLQRAAEEAGFKLEVASAYRSYERQLMIWNAKARGERSLLDIQGQELEFSVLSPEEIMFAILRWSALPGSSRHHWGTDFDVYDANTQSLEEVKLIPAETEAGGPAAGLHDWLDSQITQNDAFNFYRPYKKDRGGVSPERWHLSYYPLSNRFMGLYTSGIFKKNLEDSDILLKSELLDHAEEIYHRFFLNVDLP